MTTRKQLQEEDAAEALAHRQELVAELALLKAALDVSLPPLLKAEEGAKAKVKRAQDALQAALIQQGEAQMAHWDCSQHYDRQRGPLEKELLASAPAVITDFVAEMRALHDKVGSLPLIVDGRPWQGIDYRRSDAAEIARQEQALWDAQQRRQGRCECIRQAEHDAVGLKMLALSPDALDDKLGALRDAASDTEGSKDA